MSNIENIEQKYNDEDYDDFEDEDYNDINDLSDADYIDPIIANEIYLKKRELENNLWKRFRTSPLKELYFNLKQRGEKMDILSASLPEREITYTFLKHIKYIVQKDKNLVAYIVDETGEGKSIAAFSIGTIISNVFKKIKHVNSEIKITVDFDETLKMIPVMENCSVLIQDEDPKITGKESNTRSADFSNVLKQMRATQKCLIFCSPTITNYASLTLSFTIMGHDNTYYKTKNIEDMKSRVLIRYYPPIEEVQKKEGWLGWIDLPIGPVLEKYKQYYPDKMKHIDEMLNSGGNVNVRQNTTLIQSLVEPLSALAEENGWNGSSKSGLDVYIEILLQNINEKRKIQNEPLLSLFPNEKDMLKHLTYDRKKKQKVLKKKVLEGDNDVFYNGVEELSQTEDEMIEMVENQEYQNWDNKERDIEIYKKIKDGIIQDSLAFEYNFSDHTAIAKIKKKVDGAISLIMGHKYEYYKAKKLKELEIYDSVEVLGNDGEPDIVAIKGKTLEVYSCKWTNTTRPSISKNKKFFNPEIEYSRINHKKYTQVRCIATFFQHRTAEEIQIEIDYQKPKDSYSFYFGDEVKSSEKISEKIS